MDHQKLFDTVRHTVFGGSLSTSQVAGIEALLTACADAAVTDVRQVAYVLATPMIETGGTFVPIVENLNYSALALTSKFSRRITPEEAARYGRSSGHEADQEEIANIIYGGVWGRANLGNTEDGDGYRYRGRGLVQTTGRRLYTIFGNAADPDALCDVKASAAVMAKGMRDGTFTGKRLSDYFSAGTTDYVNARRIVNGTDRAADIAKFAQSFCAALQGAA